MYFVQEISPNNIQMPPAPIQQEATQAFYPSIAQSFLIIFLSEIADRTFIMVLIYSLKLHWIPLVITSLLAMYFMNIIAIVAGYTVLLLVPRSVLDWIGFTVFLLFGIYSVYEGKQMESRSVKEEYEEEMNKEKDNNGTEYNLMSDEGIRQEANNKKSVIMLCLELFGLLCLSEFGDKSEITTVTITAIYNIYGVLIGTMFAYLAAILIAAFIGMLVGSYLTERMMTIIGGLLFIGFTLQILIIKLFFS